MDAENGFTAPPRNVTEQRMNPFASLKECNMADDRSIRRPGDRACINAQEDYEVRYWTQKWNVSHEQLAGRCA